jgi:carboxypeptidase family protein/fibronectin type III domain protein
LTLSSASRWVLAATVLLGGCSDNPLQPGQTGDVRGTVFDASSGAALSGVTVMVGGKTAQSDPAGQYAFIGVPAGEQTLTASKDGYRQHTGTVGVVAGDTTYMNVSLAPDRGPIGLTAETGSESGQIHLSWVPRAMVESYNLYWSTSPGVTPAAGTLISGIQAISYDHSGLSPGTKYYYVLAAVNEGAEGPISAEVSATAGNGIVLKVQDPGGGFVADTNIQATVIVTSVYQLASVTATVEDRTTPLVFQSSVNNWHGLVSLTGLPSPRSRTVTFTATDVHGAAATASQSFEHNRKAVVTIESPLEGTVVQSSVRLRVTCVDDMPSGCANLKIGAATGEFSPTGQDIADGVKSFDQDISLAMFDGRKVGIGAQGTDDLGRLSFAGVGVYVDLSGHLRRAAEIAGFGTILDATADRLLIIDTLSARDRYLGTLKVQNRTTGQVTDILTRKFLDVSHAHLTTHGAVFGARDDMGFTHGHEWRDNVLLDLGILSGFVVDGPYLAWGVLNGPVHRKNLESGAAIVVPGAEPQSLSDIGPNGDVLYRSPNYEIKRFRNGSTSTLVPADPDPNVRNGFALTDGVNVCYSTETLPNVGVDRFFNLLALTSTGIDTLVVFPIPIRDDITPPPTCLPRGGWIAFTRPAGGGSVQVWARSPGGVHTQVSSFSGISVLEDVADDGRIVFINPQSQYVPRRYLWMPGSSPIDIGSGFGEARFIDGQLYVMLGRALLRVD